MVVGIRKSNDRKIHFEERVDNQESICDGILPKEITYENFVAKYKINRKSRTYRYNFNDSFMNVADLIYPRLMKRMYSLSRVGFLDIDKLLYIVEECVQKSFIHNFFLKELGRYNLDIKYGVEILTYYLIYRLFGSDMIFPMIVDEFVNEIYIDKGDSIIYLDHALIGRLSSNVLITKKKLEALLMLIKIYGDIFLAGYRPSAKTEFRIGDQRLRISVDISGDGDANIVFRRVVAVPPLFSLILDRHMRNMLAIIYVLLSMRPNIIIFGETGSGKTTLASIILGGVPEYWRLVLIEDVEEIPDVILCTKRTTRIKVPTFEARIARNVFQQAQSNVYSYKNIEITKLLHRSPDYIFVGEIQDYSDTYALFHAFSTGIRGLATTHSRDINGLFNRWLNSYKLPWEWIDLVDVLLFTEKLIAKNFIFRGLRTIYFQIKNYNANVNDLIISTHIKKINFSDKERMYLRLSYADFQKWGNKNSKQIKNFFMTIFNVISSDHSRSETDFEENAEKASALFMEISQILTNFADIINRNIACSRHSFVDVRKVIVDVMRRVTIKVLNMSSIGSL